MSGAPKDDGLSRAEIYRRAASFVENGSANYFGFALDLAGQPNPGYPAAPLQAAMDKLFGDDLFSQDAIIALCFAAAMAETGDL